MGVSDKIKTWGICNTDSIDQYLFLLSQSLVHPHYILATVLLSTTLSDVHSEILHDMDG